MEKKKPDNWKKQKNYKKGKRHYGRPGCDRQDDRE